MSTNITNVQQLAKTLLQGNPKFSGIGIFLEADELATPAQLAETDRAFETALLSQGIAVVILSPQLAMLDETKGSAISTELVVPIGICENPEVNRGEADATTTPPRSPANKSARDLLEAAIVSLIPAFHFPAQPAGRPEFAAGFCAYYLLAQRKHVIRAS
jgi:hypothetical protein